jgi:hypothetical protein
MMMENIKSSVIKVPSANIEEVQDCVDKLVLAIFEAARGHSDPSNASEKANLLLAAYQESINSVDRLLGIDKTKDQQDQYLIEQTKEYEDLKMEIMELETELKKVADRASVELEELLSDKALYLKNTDTS